MGIRGGRRLWITAALGAVLLLAAGCVDPDQGRPILVIIGGEEEASGAVPPGGGSPVQPQNGGGSAAPSGGGSGGGGGLCSTDKFWTQGEEDSPLMIPGGNCTGCHQQRGEGPIYTAAGTVFYDLQDPTNCYGVEGAVIEVTDARGKNVRMTTNRSGNFFTKERMTPPYTTRVIFQGKTREMFTEFTDLNCANCHTQQGNGAPGRIIP